MNPIKHFECSIEKIWSSDVKPESKSRHLLDVSKAIDHYVKRVDEASAAYDDAGQVQQVKRATHYLDQLSHRAQALAKQCQPASEPTAPPSPT